MVDDLEPHNFEHLHQDVRDHEQVEDNCNNGPWNRALNDMMHMRYRTWVMAVTILYCYGEKYRKCSHV